MNRTSLDVSLKPGDPIIAVRWTPERTGDQWFVREEMPDCIGVTRYGPVREDQVQQLISELRLLWEDVLLGHLKSARENIDSLT